LLGAPLNILAIMTTTREQDRWISHQVEFLRMEKLVYARYNISKGGVYFPILEYNQWKKIDFNEINWQDDHVFSFILNPVERYISGISYDLFCNPELTEILLEQGQDLLKNLLVITPHSVPLHNIFFDHIEHIDWIPAGPGWDDETNFKKLCDHHGIELDWNTAMIDLTFKKADVIRNKVSAILENDLGIGSCYLWTMLAKDQDLYKKVLDNFDGSAVSWPEVSWKNK